jgi:hypothetical protein
MHRTAQFFCYCSAGDESANAVLQCVGWHRCWREAREAVDCWSVGALRQGLPCEMRLHVVGLVWRGWATWFATDEVPWWPALDPCDDSCDDSE